MMKYVKDITLLMLLAVAVNATAQEREIYGGAVEIMELDDRQATFVSVGIDADEDEVLIAAEKNLFQKLLYEGVEGFNDDKPLVERNSPVLDNFFHGKYQKEFMGMKTGKKDVKSSLAYRAYVISSQMENKPEKTAEGKYSGNAIVIVNTANLIKYLKMNKVILDGDTVVIKENERTERPNFLRRHRKNKE